MKTVRIVGVAHSKLRNSIGAVGIEADPVEQKIYVKMARHWPREEISSIAPGLSDLYHKHEWSNTIVDQMVGEHLIQGFRRGGLPIKIIFIKKKIAEVSEIRRVKTLDLIEMVQFTLQQKLEHRIKFSPKPSTAMKELEDQIALYAEKTTEAGGVDYYAPGDELDDLTKAMMIAVFAARPFMQDSTTIVCGPLTQKTNLSIDDLSKELDPIPKFRKHIKGI